MWGKNTAEQFDYDEIKNKIVVQANIFNVQRRLCFNYPTNKPILSMKKPYQL